VLIEDDFYPANFNFVDIIVSKHHKYLPNGGYLGSYLHEKQIMAVCNGIVDAKSAVEGFAKYANPINELAPGAQTLFGTLFFGDKLADYTEDYRTLRWANRIYELYHYNTGSRSVDIFNPIQYLFDQDIKESNLGSQSVVKESLTVEAKKIRKPRKKKES
jgi:hypothetical protein